MIYSDLKLPLNYQIIGTKTMKKKRGRPEKPKSEKVRQFPFYSTERKINEAGGLVAVQKRIKELLN